MSEISLHVSTLNSQRSWKYSRTFMARSFLHDPITFLAAYSSHDQDPIRYRSAKIPSQPSISSTTLDLSHNFRSLYVFKSGAQGEKPPNLTDNEILFLKDFSYASGFISVPVRRWGHNTLNADPFSRGSLLLEIGTLCRGCMQPLKWLRRCRWPLLVNLEEVEQQ